MIESWESLRYSSKSWSNNACCVLRMVSPICAEKYSLSVTVCRGWCETFLKPARSFHFFSRKLGCNWVGGSWHKCLIWLEFGGPQNARATFCNHFWSTSKDIGGILIRICLNNPMWHTKRWRIISDKVFLEMCSSWLVIFHQSFLHVEPTHRALHHKHSTAALRKENGLFASVFI